MGGPENRASVLQGAKSAQSGKKTNGVHGFLVKFQFENYRLAMPINTKSFRPSLGVTAHGRRDCYHDKFTGEEK